MANKLKLMCVLAHPDDESLGTGGILARYSAEGVETSLVVATRGEHGWTGEPAAYPGPAALGRIRERELRAAAATLGVRETVLLPYVDGELDDADPIEVTARIATELRRSRPDVVVTFGPDGAYGHTDHIAISQLTTAAVMAAADGADDGLLPHRVSKLYFFVLTSRLETVWERYFGNIVMEFDGVERTTVCWPEWAVTTRIDTGAYWQTVWSAVACHRSQLTNYEQLAALPESEHRKLWGTQTLYRAYSAVNGGRAVESDLFAGLRF